MKTAELHTSSKWGDSFRFPVNLANIDLHSSDSEPISYITFL